MRDHMEKHQSWLYLLFIGVGLTLGVEAPVVAEQLEGLLWPLLGLLLYATFTQIPLLRVANSFKDTRFMAALMVGNFMAIPAFLAVTVVWLPLSPAVLAGVLLVLLVPCTDWFITFTHLGKGDSAQAVAATPLLLLVQMVTLPVYLWLFLGSEWFGLTLSRELLSAFAGLILTPLALAWLTEYIGQRHKAVKRTVYYLGILPVPLLALVVFIIATSQVNAVFGLSQVLVQVVFIFIGFLLFAALLGKGLGKLFKLPIASARTLAFSFGTRNSFVMLPIALTLPSAWQAAVVVVVFQSLVELLGMVAFLRWVPSRLIPELPEQKLN
ncbi:MULTISPECIES: arsenic resistance protein [unclassified Halomonas]|uniref:arsenic resistance protein n=1 Tax=unclassified Halomonas TaxID=2609666 RepID=UPI001CF4D287|nr:MULTISPECIES: arsenic resistance protein [unclassified Halomonas]MCA8863590.1 arsenic resistance protein [Halomonas sp. SBBP1]UZH08905.1 arsenic resistance protein [Halomonas sp. BDJS001]